VSDILEPTGLPVTRHRTPIEWEQVVTQLAKSPELDKPFAFWKEIGYQNGDLNAHDARDVAAVASALQGMARNAGGDVRTHILGALIFAYTMTNDVRRAQGESVFAI